MAKKKLRRKKKSIQRPPKKQVPGIPANCIFCGAFTEKKFDKRGKLYMLCRFCGSAVFMGTIMAEIGYEIMEDKLYSDPVGFKMLQQKKIKDTKTKEKNSEKTTVRDKELDLMMKTLGISLPDI